MTKGRAFFKHECALTKSLNGKKKKPKYFTSSRRNRDGNLLEIRSLLTTLKTDFLETFILVTPLYIENYSLIRYFIISFFLTFDISALSCHILNLPFINLMFVYDIPFKAIIFL